jgi:archaellum biogenesis ATPase FlaH
MLNDDDMPPLEAYSEFEPCPPTAGAGLLEPAPAVEIPTVDVGGCIDNPSPPPAFVWEGLVPRGFVCLLSGHGGSGKSTLSLQLAVAVAMGLPLLGVPTQPGRVLVFSGEDSGPLLRHRLAEVCRALDVNPHALASRLMVLDATEEPGLYRELSEFGRHTVEPTPTFHRLAEIVTEWQPSLIVADNASDCFEGSENDRAQVRAFVRGLANLSRQSESRPAVLLLTHTPKQAVRGGGESYSGSTAWHNSARARLSLTPAKDDETRLTLSLDKLNIAPLRREPLRLVRSHGGVLVLDEGARDTTGEPTEPPTTALLRLLADFNQRGEHVSPEQSARNNAWKMLRPEAGFPKRAYSVAGPLFSAMRELERRGLIERAEYVNAHRKRYEQWLLTAKGWEEIGESAPTAPTAPTSGVSALDAEVAGAAPTAPTSGAKEYEGKERAQVSAQEGANLDNHFLAESSDVGADVGTRADGTNPRALGTNPRAKRKGGTA